MTRHRQGQALAEIFSKKCTGCNGNAHVVEDFHWARPAGADDSRYGNQNFPYKTQQQQA
jgi:Ribonuclease G/E